MTFLDALQDNIVVSGNTASLNIQTTKDVWKDLNRCFSAFRAKWVGGNSQHWVFPCSPNDFIDFVVNSQSMPKLNPHSYHPTKNAEALESIFEHTSANPDNWTYRDGKIKIVEPSAGEGALVEEIHSRFTKAKVDFELIICELDPLNLISLKSKFSEHDNITIYGGDFMEQSFTNIDLVVANPPFSGTTWLKHLRHAQSMLNRAGRLVGIVPTQNLYTTSNKAVKSFSQEVAFYNVDPLDLPSGTFATAPETKTRIVETRHPDIVTEDLNHPSTIIHNADILRLNCENDASFVHNAKRGECIEYLISRCILTNKLKQNGDFINDVIRKVCLLSFQDKITCADAYYTLYPVREVEPSIIDLIAKNEVEQPNNGIDLAYLKANVNPISSMFECAL